MTAVHQFVPSYVGRSAITTHVDQVTRILTDLGVRTHTYVGEARDVPLRQVSPYAEYRPVPGEPTWLLYQLSIGHPMADFLSGTAEPLVVNYHNVTPEEFFQPWEPLVVPELRLGREQLAALAARTELGIAVSRYNEVEMMEAGYPATTTTPFLADYEQLGSDEDPATARRLAEARRGGGAGWLFVGRISPNKAQHRLVQAFAVYRRLYDRRARLWLVGGMSSHRYNTTITDLIRALDLGDSVTLTGSIPQPALVAHYRHADVYVSLSEHEGFGVPLVEAMWHRLPVVALGSSGVPGTLGPAGLILPAGRAAAGGAPNGRVSDGGPGGGTGGAPGWTSVAHAAAAVHRVLSDDPLRQALVAAGAKRYETFSLEAASDRFRRAVAGLVDP